jgi:hypothetical protein
LEVSRIGFVMCKRMLKVSRSRHVQDLLRMSLWLRVVVNWKMLKVSQSPHVLGLLRFSLWFRGRVCHRVEGWGGST